MAVALPANIPSPSINSFSIGPLVIHFYALAYLVGIAAAIIITRRRWRAVGGDPDIVGDIALWSVPAGIIGGRIYFDITTPMDIPHVWYGVFAVWDGGLGIWGGIALATVVGLWRLRRHGVNTAQFMDAVAPPCWWRRASAGSATTSTRNSSAARPRCPGAWRSPTSTGCPAGSPTST